jgi:hypothetical protein
MPLSKRQAARDRQLANLARGDNPAPAGNRRAVTHGGYARIAAERLDAKAREVFEALSLDAPLRARGGELPAADSVAVRLLADALCRLEDVAADIRDHGWRDRTSGEQRPVVDLEQRLRREALDYCEALGMTPRSRGRLGLDLARTYDASVAWSEPDPTRRRAMLAELGVEEDE